MPTMKRMNGQPLRFAILREDPSGQQFMDSSHTSIERARRVIAEMLVSPGYRYWVTELVEPGLTNRHNPVPAHTVLEGPYDINNYPVGVWP